MLYRTAQRKLFDSKKLCRPLQELPKRQHALKQPDAFDFTAVKDLKGFGLSIIPGEDALKKLSTPGLCNPKFIAAVESIDRTDGDRGIARYPSTN